MKEKIFNKKNIIIISIALLIFLLILKDVFQYEITSYDNWAYKIFVEELRSNNMTVIMKIITSFGSIFVISCILLLLMFLYKNKNTIYLIAIHVLSIVLINDFLKFLVHRPRPNGYNLITESNYSFPSGHSMVSTVFYGFLIYIIYNEVKNKILKILLITLLSLIIVLTCISRVYLGVHYLSDTIAGFMLSIIYLIIFISYNHKNKKENKNEK